MSGPCQHRESRLVDRAFVRGLPARQRRKLRAHFATCESCRARWDRLAAVERQMGGPRLCEAVVDDIAETVIATPRSRRVWWAGGSIGAVIGACVVMLVMRPGVPAEELSPRGAHTHGRTPGVRLFCVAGNADQVRAEKHMVSSGDLPELRCTIDDDLQLAYTTPDREGLTMVAFARLDSTMIHYAPTTNTGGTSPVHANRVDELVEWSTPLAAEHQLGTYEVVVRFFDHEMAARDAIDGRVPPVTELRARLNIIGRGGLDDAR